MKNIISARMAKRITAFFMAALLAILSVGLVACGDRTNSESNETGDETSAETTGTDVPEEKEPGITIFENGKMTCDIVVADNVSSIITGAVNSMKDSIKNELGASASVRNEETFKFLNEGKLDIPKIVVGTLEGDEYSNTLVSELENDGDYIITVNNGSLYIIGKTDVSTAIAVNKFISCYVSGGATTISFEAGKVSDIPADYQGLKIAGEQLTDYVIVYYDSSYAKLCAEDIRAAIEDKTGVLLPIVSDSSYVSEHEILVGKTNRTEVKALRESYDRPNVYYDIKTVGKKLIVMGEGYRTLAKVAEAFESYLDTAENNADIKGEIATGNILADVDAVDYMTKALEKEDSVDARVLHWNMAAPLSWSQSGTAWADNWPFEANKNGWKQRAEQQADVVLIYNPDIVTTNEIYNYHASGVQYKTFVKELSDYFTEVDSTYDTRDDDLPLNVSAVPLEKNQENPEKIFIRKGKFSVVDSGFRHISDNALFHGIHWAVLQTNGGQKFIISVGHYGDARTEVTYPSENISAIAFAQKCSGSSTLLPTILTGDMFTGVNHGAGSNGAGYRYLAGKGYIDSQVSATLNCNEVAGTLHGTYHNPMNDTSKTRLSEDFVWYNNKLKSSKFGVISIPESTNTSDHWPVFSDLSFIG